MDVFEAEGCDRSRVWRQQGSVLGIQISELRNWVHISIILISHCRVKYTSRAPIYILKQELQHCAQNVRDNAVACQQY